MTFDPIAIIGQGCVLPSGLGVHNLWETVRNAQILIRDVDKTRWRIPRDAVLCEPSHPLAEHCWNSRGGYVSTDLYPAQDSLDPVFVWTKQASIQALKHIKIKNPSRMGLVLGNLSFPTAKMNQYTEFKAGLSPWVDERNRFMSGLPARWVANELGIQGPAYALDSACASALYAIEQACTLLHSKSCDLMLAGAVNAADDLFLHMGFSALQALSKSGQSRPFHAEADGLIPAEGAGMVVLKRLSDALRDSDSILGVIRGIGLSNDGRERGLLVPSQKGQVDAMKRAYTQANIDPSSVGWLECHATGTPVGDGTEIKSMAEIFTQRTPISSLKANMGHLITASGVAGLLKVLQAFAHDSKPPSPIVEKQHPLLTQSPFFVLEEEQVWKNKQRAGISAFGFGGNNAHLIIDKFVESSFIPSVASVVPTSSAEVVLVGMALQLGELKEVASLQTHQRNPTLYKPSIDSLAVSLSGLRFPPNDIKHGLAQQNLILYLVQQITQQHEIPERTGVWIGMGTDLSVTRYGLRWRTRDNSAIDSSIFGDQCIPSLEAAGVVGCMPNIVANRLNAQWGWTGPSGTISAEELSGVYAVRVAMSALQAGDVDAAIVGAVDFSCDPLHVSPTTDPADGAVVWLLKRKSDIFPSDTVYATISNSEQALWTNQLSAVPHAAAALMECTAAILDASQKERGLSVCYADMTGHTQTLNFVKPLLAPAQRDCELVQPVLVMPAHLPPVPNLRHAPKLPSQEDLIVLQRQRKTASSQQSFIAVEHFGSFLPVQNAPEPPEIRVEDAKERDPVVVLFQQQMHDITAMHEQHLIQQAQIHNAFLEQRKAFDALLFREGVSAGWGEHHPIGSKEPFSSSFVPQQISVPTTVPQLHPSPNKVSPPATSSKATSKKKSAPKTHNVEKMAASPTGLTLSREDLVVHSRGAISSIYGAMFQDQDQYEIQTRMPEPPLLLADRVTGIDAQPGSMSTGTLWSETDVCSNSWYLHQNRMPAGIMIESGQADLMLISYLGIDLLCKGERAYRLLGCELMYHDDLPQVGETLRYDIHVDGHAKHGDVRLFFFHYDCRINGAPRLTVRDGQAGFFTKQELGDSAGILWRAEEQDIDANARIDAPLVDIEEKIFSFAQVQAFANGRPWDCFGASHMRTRTHTRTPRIQAEDMLFLRGDVLVQTKGGPWGRGYLRLEVPISPSDWFFEGHFKNDPCMPGTLMFEGCLQAMAFYLSAIGCTIERDGWRFQPMRNRPYPLRCRGQVTPESKVLVYEIFVEEVVTGPIPHLVADLLCTVDGLGAFHARGMGLELVPDFPMYTMPELLNEPDSRPCATDKNGFSFDRRAMIASALGKPSEAFGTMYTPFDSYKRVARLPSPPYHFMSRVSAVRGELGTCVVGTEIELEYDIPQNAWYFDANGHRVMPFAVFLEAALQPCGWLASAVGSALRVEEELFFRNLDGNGVLHNALYPEDGRLTSIVKITGISQSGGMIIESFAVQCFVEERCIYTLDTVFGFFPQQALANQIGLPTSDAHRKQLQPHSFLLELGDQPKKYFGRSARLADTMLCMLDRITAFDDQGTVPFVRGEKDVDPNEWFFKAHFFQDPVQPGSLGIEAMIQLLQFYMLHTDMHAGMKNPVFEPLALQRSHKWKYRGQVLPHNKLITTTMHIIQEGTDERGVYALADASLWVDGKRIYEASGLGMRLVESSLLKKI